MLEMNATGTGEEFKIVNPSNEQGDIDAAPTLWITGRISQSSLIAIY